MLDMRVVSAQEMRNLDNAAVERYGIPSLILMENAGRAVCDAATDLLGDVRGARVLIVAGQGNNGGDGLVVARHLHNAGASVTVFYFGDRSAAKGDAQTNLAIAENMGIGIDYSRRIDLLEEAVAEADIVIDALLGTGVQGSLRPEAAEVIGCMNRRTGAILLAVDIPSGIDADSGVRLGPESPDGDGLQSAVCADVTVTFACLKTGLIVNADTQHYTGHLLVADIGIPRECIEDVDSGVYALDGTESLIPLPPRSPESHKGTYGHLAVIAGSVGMTGAAALAAEGALRSGAGLVTVAAPESLNDILEVKLTEAMTIPVPEGQTRAFGMASLESVLRVIEARDAAVIGPGFGRDADTVAFTLELVRRLTRPAVIDADALYAIARNPEVLVECKADLVLTPHPGEMAMLAGTVTSDVQSNRLETARRFAAEYGVTVVLKGARTIVAEPYGNAFINTSGTPAMAGGGVGDVLTGLLGGLLVQEADLPQWVWANTAVYVHGRAGEMAAENLGEAAVIASDVLNFLPKALRELESGEEAERE